VLDLDSTLREQAAALGDIEYVSLIDYFCNEDGCLTHLDRDVVSSTTSYDYGHLTPIASLYLARDVLVPKILNPGH